MPATENQNLDSEIASLLGRGEDLTLEFKSDLKSLSDRDLRLRTCALASTHMCVELCVEVRNMRPFCARRINRATHACYQPYARVYWAVHRALGNPSFSHRLCEN